MSEQPENHTRLRPASLSQRKPFRFELTLDAETCAALARDLGAQTLRKVTFKGAFHAEGKHDWKLDAHLGATAVQPCVVSLAPVTTRIEEHVTRLYLKDWQDPDAAEEIEIPQEDTAEPLTAEIDLIDVIREALALGLPDYPRAPDAQLERAVFAADGVTPLSDEDVKPFSGLSTLKDKLGKP